MYVSFKGCLINVYPVHVLMQIEAQLDYKHHKMGF